MNYVKALPRDPKDGRAHQSDEKVYKVSAGTSLRRLRAAPMHGQTGLASSTFMLFLIPASALRREESEDIWHRQTHQEAPKDVDRE